MTLMLTAQPNPLRSDATGTVRIGRTRVTLDTVIAAHRQGATPEQIGDGFPSLALADIYATIGYYLRNKAQVDEYLEQRRVEAEEIRRAVEKQCDTRALRASLARAS